MGTYPAFWTDYSSRLPNYQGNNLPNPPAQDYVVNSPQNAAAWVTYDMTQGIAASMEVGNNQFNLPLAMPWLRPT